MDMLDDVSLAALLFHAEEETENHGTRQASAAFAEQPGDVQRRWIEYGRSLRGVLANKAHGFAILPLVASDAMVSAGWPHVESSWGPDLAKAWDAMAKVANGPLKEQGEQ